MVRLPPPLRQEKEDNCALACLRSLLSHYGIEVAEATLEPLANKQDWGVGIEDLAAAARSFNLKTEIAKLDTTAIARCLAKASFRSPTLTASIWENVSRSAESSHSGCSSHMLLCRFPCLKS